MRRILASMLFASGLVAAPLAVAGELVLNEAGGEISTSDNPGAPINVLSEGSYTSASGYFTNFEITSWGNESIATGLVNYGGIYSDFEVTLERTDANLFSGSGFIKAIYGRSQVCRFPIDIKIEAYANGLYVRSRQPQALPGSMPVNYCTGAGATVILRHAAPYVLNGNDDNW